MTPYQPTAQDYPLAERRPELVRGAGGKALDEINLAALAHGSVSMEDLRITPDALRQQASIARDAGRAELADNFERAAEMATLPQGTIMSFYELLRPGRAKNKQELLAAAERLRTDHDAPLIAAFVEEAAEVYERRGLFRFRF